MRDELINHTQFHYNFSSAGISSFLIPEIMFSAVNVAIRVRV